MILTEFMGGSKGRQLTHTLRCDICAIEFTQPAKTTKVRRTRQSALGKDLCPDCSRELTHKALAERGTRSLKSFTPEQKQQYCSEAGKKSASVFDPEKGTRFTRARWDSLSPEVQRARVTKANEVAVKRRREDPEHAAEVYAKIFKQKQLGYMSKGHKQLHECLEQYGFSSHTQISSMQVDECCESRKLVIEFNGDMWHCNPKYWAADDYNTAIKMTAREKWDQDLRRQKMLEQLGYTVVYIWESEWKLSHSACVKRIQEVMEKQDVHSIP